MQRSFFFHIPKCAGMSVWTALWDIYGFNNVYQVGIKDQRLAYEAMTPEERGAYGAIGGHGYLHRLMSYIDPADYFKFVTFRNPVDRIVSEYHFIRGLPAHFKHDAVSNMSLIEFAHMKDVTNMQTRLLCKNKADPELALKLVDTSFDDWCLLDDISALIGRLYANHGAKAKAAEHANKGPGGSVQTEDLEVIAEIEKLNVPDMEFFRELQRLAADKISLACVDGPQTGRIFTVPREQDTYSIPSSDSESVIYRSAAGVLSVASP